MICNDYNDVPMTSHDGKLIIHRCELLLPLRVASGTCSPLPGRRLPKLVQKICHLAPCLHAATWISHDRSSAPNGRGWLEGTSNDLRVSANDLP